MQSQHPNLLFFYSFDYFEVFESKVTIYFVFNRASNIEACFLGSAQKDTASIKQEMFTGKYRLIYITPEYAVTALSDFQKLDQDIGQKLKLVYTIDLNTVLSNVQKTSVFTIVNLCVLSNQNIFNNANITNKFYEQNCFCYFRHRSNCCR